MPAVTNNFLALPALSIFGGEAGQTAIKCDDKTHLVVKTRNGQVDGLAIGYDHGGKWFYQHFFYSLGGGEKYFLAIKKLYRHLVQNKMTDLTLSFLVRSNKASLKNQYRRKSQSFKTLEELGQRMRKKADDQASMHHWILTEVKGKKFDGYCHEFHSASGRTWIIKKQQGKYVFELTIQLAGESVSFELVTGLAGHGYSADEKYDRMAFMARRTHHKAYVDLSMERSIAERKLDFERTFKAQLQAGESIFAPAFA